MKLPLRSLLLGGCLLSAGALLAGCTTYSWDAVQGSGVEASATRDVPAFTRVHVSGSADLRASVGGAQALRVSCDDNLLEFVRTEVHDGTLEIGMQPGSYSFRRGLVVELGVPELEAVGISGSGTATVEGLSGGSFEATVSGSGDVRASGSVESLTVSVSGSGDMDLSELAVRQAHVGISGSGDVAVDVSEDLDVQISGSGDVRYTGAPRTNARISGSGSVSGS